MKRLLGRIALFALPFVLLTVFVAVVDPFDCIGISRAVPEELKFNIALPLHNPLWKVEKFQQSPRSRLILGDSAMASIDPDDIRRVTGEDYFNFAYGGGTLVEAIDTYWLAASKVHLDTVVLGIALINFNEYQNLNRVPEARALVASRLRYLTNRVVLDAAFLSAYVAVTGRVVGLGLPGMSREDFWRFQLEESLPQLLHEYRYPRSVAAQLQDIAADCRRHGTRLVIVIPPNHIELQAKTVELGRGADQERFKAFVATLGTVYDLDYPNAFTADRANFSDPFHTASDATVIEEVWQERGRFSRRTPGP